MDTCFRFSQTSLYERTTWVGVSVMGLGILGSLGSCWIWGFLGGFLCNGESYFAGNTFSFTLPIHLPFSFSTASFMEVEDKYLMKAYRCLQFLRMF